MTRDVLITKLHTTLNNFIYGVALRCCFPDARWPELASEQLSFESTDGKSASVKLAPIAERLSDSNDREDLINEYEKSLKRTLLREGHEIILAYCEVSNQFSKYKDEPWFQFARIIRNVVSHKDGGILKEWPKDLTKKSITTVSWRTRTLDTSMIGKFVEFTPYEAIQLFDDQKTFAETKLS